MFHTTIENFFIQARQEALELWAWKITTRPTREHQVNAAEHLHTAPTSTSYKVNKYAVSNKAQSGFLQFCFSFAYKNPSYHYTGVSCSVIVFLLLK
jgi:hypothetical protein